MTKASSDALTEPGALLLLESAFALGAARLFVLVVPFRLYSRWMGKDAESAQETTAPDVLHRVSRALESVSRHVPWRSQCLEQALAAKAMLRRRGISNTLYVAVAREVALEAHAWLRSGDICVTGQAEFDRYTVVARFADEARR
jgi:hypothetical protein